MAPILVALLLAAPVEGAIAVHWREAEPAEAPDEELRVSLREGLAARDGRPVEAVRDRARTRARVAVSREFPRRLRELRIELREDLDEADAAFREGRFADARAELGVVLARLRAHPELPGAAASAREAHLLAARIAWAEGEVEVAEAALADALRLDPEAQLSASRAPPELVERYRSAREGLLAARESAWVEAEIELGDSPGASVEIDGVPGLRPVPPGEHFVVVYREGREAVAAWRRLDRAWTPPMGAERIAEGEPREAGELEPICAALDLDVLVLAERRSQRVGLQGYRCGQGFGARWIGAREQLGDGVEAVTAGPFTGDALELDGPWPAPTQGPPPTIVEPPPEPPRPWYRKGWIWGTSAGVVAAITGGVVAGVLLGGRGGGRAGVGVDADDFIGGF